MKFYPFLRGVGLAVLINIALTGATVCRSQAMYHLSLDTSGLIGASGGPFSIDFQFTDGSGTGDANNTVTITNFHFDSGGGLVGSPTTTGGVSGDLSSTVTMTDSAFFNEYTQVFTPGDPMQADILVTLNPDVGAPDEFSLALLDGMGNEIPTTASNDSFLTVDLTATGASVETAGTSSAAGVIVNAPVVFAVVPEPSSLALMAGSGLVGLALLKRRRKA